MESRLLRSCGVEINLGKDGGGREKLESELDGTRFGEKWSGAGRKRAYLVHNRDHMKLVVEGDSVH